MQLGHGREKGTSPGLAAAIVKDAERATADLDWGACLDRRPMRRVLGLAGVVGLLVVAYANTMPERFGNGLARVMAPWADIPAYTATRVLETGTTPSTTGS